MKQVATRLLTSEAAPEEICQEIAQLNDPDSLYYFIWHYNWNDGLAIPQAVLDHPACDRSIALLIFFRGDGISFLIGEEYEWSHWQSFISTLFERLNSGYYKQTIYEIIPEVTKVQAFKISKKSPELPRFYVEGFQGKQVDLTI